jgi:hypothetical protein
VSFLSNLKERLNQETTNGENGGMDKEEGVTRIFFATDVHGSTVCWRKFLNSAEFYDADVLVLGGDTTGKHESRFALPRATAAKIGKADRNICRNTLV